MWSFSRFGMLYQEKSGNPGRGLREIENEKGRHDVVATAEREVF
jgi:hypothetical protein